MNRHGISFCMGAAIAAALFVLPVATSVHSDAPAPAALALVGGRVIAAPDAAPVEDAAVVLEGGRIVAVGPRATVNVPKGTTTIDCRSLVVVAGFQNSHVHFSEQQWTNAAGQPAARLTGQLQSMLTAHGFTTVVDTGSLLENTVALRRRIEARQVPGPRILTAGVPLYPPNGIPFYLKDGSIPPELMKLMPQPATPNEAESAVDRDIVGGADLIKLFTGSWVARGRVLPMPVDVAAAAVREAHRRGRMVYAHTSSISGLEVTLSSGVDVIAHALDDTRGLTAEHLGRAVRQKVALVPTLTLFGDEGNAAEILREVTDYSALGGDILFGTDVGYHHMYDTRRELELLGRTGLSWRQVLASLTTTPARRFNETDRRGRLAPGMDADVVVLGGDPAADVRAFADVRLTIRGGQVIYDKAGARR